MICNNGPKSVLLRSSVGKEGMKSIVQGHALFIQVVWGLFVTDTTYLLTYCVELLLLGARARVGKGGDLLLFPWLHVRSQVCWKAV